MYVRKHYKISCYINGVEDYIRTTTLNEMTDLEKSLGAWSEEVSQSIAYKIREKIIKDRKDFIKPSEDTYFNYDKQFKVVEKFRKELDVTISQTNFYGRTKLFEHSKELIKYIRENKPIF